MKGYRRLLYWAALPIRDRRWAAPLSALALGLGLFVGIAIGPGAAGTLATGGVKVLELPGFGDRTEPVASGAEHAASPAAAAASPGTESPASTSGSFSSGTFESLPVEETAESPAPETEEAAPEKEAPASEEEPEEGESVAGVVVHVNKAAGSYVVAEAGGTLSAVHAPTAPRPGTAIEAPVRLLANETFAEAGQRTRVGAETRATLSGIVTFVGDDPLDPTYTLSKRGASMLIHVPADPSGAMPELPALGAFATVGVEIEKGESAPPLRLRQRNLEVDGEPLTSGEFAGIVATVDPDAHQLQISADDIRESGRDLTIEAPPEFDLAKVEPGASVLATATIEPDGRLILTALSSDEHRVGAEAEPFLHLFHTLDTGT